MNKPEEAVIYTDHALQRMSVRGIAREMVEAALVSPEQTMTGYRNRTLATRALAIGELKLYMPQKMTSLLLSL